MLPASIYFIHYVPCIGTMKKLETTRKIPADSTIRVYKKGFGYSKIRVVEEIDHFLATFSDAEFHGNIDNGDAIEAYLWVENIASYEFTLVTIGKTCKEPYILLFDHTEKITRSEERKCLGADTSIPVEFFVFSPSEFESSLSSEKVVMHEGTIVWLEDREAVLKSTIPIKDDMFLRSHVTFDGEEIEILGKVHSINKEKNFYNIIYTGINDRDRNLILDHIFSIYRE